MTTTSSPEHWLKAIGQRHFLVVGDVMLDHYLIGDAARISPEAPVPVVDIAEDTYRAGGAANVALNLSCLGARCTLAGAIGPDEAGQHLRQVLAEAGIQIVPLPEWPHCPPTIVKARVLARGQQLCRLDREAAPAAYAPPAPERWESLREAVTAADAVLVSDYAKGFLSAPLWQALQDASPAFCALDPKPPRGLMPRGMSLLTPNLGEALRLADLTLARGETVPEAALCARLLERYQPQNLVVTLGAEGMLLARPGEPPRRVPAIAREVFDVSGAGDTAVALLAAVLSLGATLTEAARLATAAASVVVSKVGTATATAEEVLREYGRAFSNS